MKPADSPVKVLRVITRLNIGGPARQIDSLVTYLDPIEFNHVVVAGSVADDEIEHDIASGPNINLRRVPELGRSVNFMSDIKAFIALIRIIRLEKPTIIHTHLAKAGLLGRLAAFICRVPIRIHTFHGHLLHGYFTGLKLRGYIVLERLLKSITTFQVCVGEEVRQDLIRAKIVNEKASVAVYPGIQAPATIEKSRARQNLRINENQFVVLFVGRLVDIKRLDRFIRIINQVSESVPELLAIVIGDGPSREPAEALVLHSKTVRFEGWKRDLGVYFSAADVVCLTSDNEGMPIALIEAALCGVPSVAANVGSTKEVVLDGLTGFVVKADDEAAYVEHLINLFKDPVLRNKLSINAIDHGNNTFGAERLAKDHAIIYQTQLAEMSK